MTQIQIDKEKQVLYDHYSQLIGFKITEVQLVVDFSSDETCVVLIAKKGKQEVLIDVLSDEEGNGTGFLEIIKMNENEEK